VSWPPKTFRDMLATALVASGVGFPGLSEGLERIDQALAANTWPVP